MHQWPPKSASRAAWAACAALVCAPSAARADWTRPDWTRSDWTLAAAAELRHDDNVGNAHGEYNTVGDYAASAKLSLFDLLQLGGGYSLALGGNVSGEVYDHLIGLRNGSLDVVMSLKKKFGVGAFAPWLRVAVSPGRTNFDDGYRDSTTYRAAAEFGNRTSARWNFWGEYLFERRLATPVAGQAYAPISTDVFSGHGRSLIGNAEYSLSERIALSAGAQLRRGDVVSTQYPGAYTYMNARAAVADPTFGPNQIAYRFFGTSYGVRAGLNLALNAHNLVGIGVQRTETHALGGNGYADTVPDVIWNYRF